MAAPRLLPDRTTLERLRRNGATYKAIAEQYGVSETAVYFQLKQAGIAKDRTVTHKGLIPWTVRGEHHHTHPALMLRTLSRRAQGLENAPERDAMLNKWLGEMKEANAVVCYDPDMGPNPASPVTGGWFYMKRRPSDGDSLIRYAKPGKGLPRGYRKPKP
jgi:hypothetical protein